MLTAKRRRSAVRGAAPLAVAALLLTAPGGPWISSSSAAVAEPSPTSPAPAPPRTVTRPSPAKPAPGRRVVTRPTVTPSAAPKAAPNVAPNAAEADASTGSTSFAYTSAAGDYIGQGQSQTLTSSADVTVSITGTESHLSVSAHANDFSTWWYADLSAGAGDTLHPGTYLNAERGATGRSPGLDAYGDGRGCNEIYGSFTVNQIGFDSTGAVDLADVTFTQHCETSSAPAFKGTIHLNQFPLSYRQVSDAGDYIGGGTTKTYVNSTSIIGVQGNAGAVSLSVSGLRDWWYGSLTAPIGAKFVVGKTYQTARSAEGSLAGLDIYGDGRGCNTSTGTLTIKKLQLSADGAITNLSAVFEQHCEGGTPALHGTLHYFA